MEQGQENDDRFDACADYLPEEEKNRKILIIFFPGKLKTKFTNYFFLTFFKRIPQKVNSFSIGFSQIYLSRRPKKRSLITCSLLSSKE